MMGATLRSEGKNRASWSGYLLVFLMLVLPMIPALFYLKVILLGVVLVSIAVAALKTGQTGIHSSIALWTLSLCVVGAVFVLEGLLSGKVGAAQVMPLYVIWPIIYAVMIAGVRNQGILSGIRLTFIVATICIGIYSLLYILAETGILPESRFAFLFYSPKQGFAVHDEWAQMAYPGLNPLIFLVPFTFAELVMSSLYPKAISPLYRICLWTAFALGLEAVLLSGRRALYLGTLIAPPLILLFASFQLKTERRLSWKSLVRVTSFAVILLAICIFTLNAAYGATLSGIVERLSMGFNFSPTAEDIGTTERRTQFHALLQGWMENPLLGAGYGAPAYGSIRDDLAPYNYELTYMQLLYQTGLVGFAAYSAGVCWIYWMGVRVIRAGGYLSGLMLACLVGMSSFLIGNATNPYFGSFETYWAIFLPLTVINLWLLRPFPRRLSVCA